MCARDATDGFKFEFRAEFGSFLNGASNDASEGILATCRGEADAVVKQRSAREMLLTSRNTLNTSESLLFIIRIKSLYP